MSQAMLPRSTNQVRWVSAIYILAGLWMIVAPFVLGYADMQGALWSDVAVGIAIAAIAAGRVSGAFDEPWLSWVNGALGLWLIISPWVLGFVESSTAMWNNVIGGAVVLILAGWTALMSPSGAGPTAVG